MGTNTKTHNLVQMGFAPPPRSCEVTKWPEVQGYGFTLHNNKETRLQGIGKVDPGSPAQAAGLKPRDIIIEINGTNVTRETHKQIVERIKSSGESTTFLVVDQECKDYHDQHGNVISSSMPNGVHLSSARNKADSRKSSLASSSESEDEDEGHESEEEEVVETKPTNEENLVLETVQEDIEKDSDEEDRNDYIVHKKNVNEEDNETNKNAKNDSAPVSDSSFASSSDEEEEEKENLSPVTPAKDPEPTFKPPPPMRSKRNSSQQHQRASQIFSGNKDELVAGLSLNLSAKEMKDKIKDEAQRDSWKRNDQRLAKGMSFKDKVKYIKDMGKKQIN